MMATLLTHIPSFLREKNKKLNVIKNDEGNTNFLLSIRAR